MFYSQRFWNEKHGPSKARGVQRSSTIPVEYGLPASMKEARGGAIRACCTMPDDLSSEPPEIERTGSGGFAFLRKRSAQEKEQIARSRAQELCVLYEQSDVKDDTLNKTANIRHPVRQAPSMAAGGNLQQALAAYNKSKQDSINKARTDPLLTKHERDEILKEEQKQEPSTATKRTKPRLQVDADLPAEEGVEIVGGTPLSVEETVAMTPSPHSSSSSPAFGSMYHASNGQSYWVKNLC